MSKNSNDNLRLYLGFWVDEDCLSHRRTYWAEDVEHAKEQAEQDPEYCEWLYAIDLGQPVHPAWVQKYTEAREAIVDAYHALETYYLEEGAGASDDTLLNLIAEAHHILSSYVNKE